MGTKNPYAPPAAEGAAAEATGEGISFNDYDLERVSRMTSWMGTVARIQFILGLLLAGSILLVVLLAGPRALFSNAVGIVMVAVGGGYVVLLLLGSVWLRQSCIAFYDGVLSDSETPLATGFRKLRLYFMLYGIAGLAGLVIPILRLAGR